MKRIYCDYAATTPIAPEVVASMQPWLEGGYGNPSSLHGDGRRAKEAIDQARELFSSAFGSLFGEVTFTSSGTESVNLCLIGAALGNVNPERNRILLGAAEHHCVLYTREILERLGYSVEIVPVTAWGEVQSEECARMLGPDVLLLSVMHANNELGTLNDVAKIGDVAKKAGALFHVDAVQTFPGQWKVDDWQVDLVSVSAHKFYGPKGVGAAYIRGGTKMKPILVGGGQEREMRAGTENVAAIVGARTALELAMNSDWKTNQRQVRDLFESEISDIAVFTVPLGVERLPGHSHLRIPGVDAEIALIRLDRMGLSASSGAACSSGSLEPSHVLLACGYSETEAREGLRFTFGKESTLEDARQAAKMVKEASNGILQAHK